MLQQLIPPQLQKCKILVADDDEWNCAYIYEVLAAYGFHNVLSISDSTKVVDMVRGEEPDILLLDLYMPAPDGFQILEALSKSLPAEKQMPVLVITSDEDSLIKKRALELGASDFLPKPFEEIVVAARVANLLKVSQSSELKSWSKSRENPPYPLNADTLQGLLEKIPAGVVLVAGDDQIKYANEEFCRLFSIRAEPEQLVGESWLEAVKGLKEDFVDAEGFAASDLAIRQESTPVDREIWHLEGSRVFERDYVPLILEGGSQGHLWIFRDVTLATKLQSGAASL